MKLKGSKKPLILKGGNGDSLRGTPKRMSKIPERANAIKPWEGESYKPIKIIGIPAMIWAIAIYFICFVLFSIILYSQDLMPLSLKIIMTLCGVGPGINLIASYFTE